MELNTEAIGDKEELWYKGRMTQLQFAALGVRCDPDVAMREASELLLANPRRLGKQCNVRQVRARLTNGWSTEQLLAYSYGHLEGDALKHSLHWAFPQAYYSAFAVALGAFEALGFTESAHASVLSKVGSEMASGRYPRVLCFLADGAEPYSFHGVGPYKLPRPLYWNASSPEAVDAHIRQFLRTTRKGDLKEKKRSIRHIKTQAGKRRKAFRAQDWRVVSDALGPTTVLSLLYRKRIKSNYRDVDTYFAESLDAKAIYSDLRRIVAALNGCHEAFVFSAMGNAYKTILPDEESAPPRIRARALSGHLGLNA